MKNYYFILGINIYAREEDIKRTYRQLALQYHPDVNPSPEAEAKFKEINEAYEVLGDPQRKLLYDQMLVGIEPEVVRGSQPHRDPRYRPKSAEYIRQVRAEKKPHFEFMKANLRYAQLASRLALLFAAVLLADYSMVGEKSTQVITNTEKKFGNQSIRVEVGQGTAFTLGGKSVSEFGAGATISIYTSPIFKVPTQIENDLTHFRAGLPITIYGNFFFGPILLLVTALVGSFYWKGVEFRFNLGVMNVLLIILNFMFLNIHSF
ncbi:MAG: J domain-containing protein [Flammeovirgaceae bacterium]